MGHIRCIHLIPMILVGCAFACLNHRQAADLPAQSSKANEQEHDRHSSAASISSSEEFDVASVVQDLLEGDGAAAREALSALTAQKRVLIYRNLVDAFADMPADHVVHHAVHTDLAQWLTYRLVVECRGERLQELFTNLLESVPDEHEFDWFKISEARELIPVGSGIVLISGVPDDMDLHSWIRKDPPDQAIRWHIRICHEPNGSTRCTAIRLNAPPAYSFTMHAPEAGNVLITLPATLAKDLRPTGWSCRIHQCSTPDELGRPHPRNTPHPLSFSLLAR